MSSCVSHLCSYPSSTKEKKSTKILLADVNIPFNLSMDVRRGKLFFSINADDFSDQSFHLAVLNMDNGTTQIIPGIRNGYTSAVDGASGNIYLGGSDGIFKYNFNTSSVDQPAVLHGFDILDMFYKDKLYFVDTSSQNLNIVKKSGYYLLNQLKEQLVQCFVVDKDDDILFVNPSGLHVFRKKSKTIELFENTDLNYRCAATDNYGVPYITTNDGIYLIDKDNKQLQKIVSVDSCYGLSFDEDNNIVYSDHRSVVKLFHC